MYDTTDLINIDYYSPKNYPPEHLTLHNRASISMILDALNQLDSILLSKCKYEKSKSLFDRYDSVDFIEKMALSREFKTHDDNINAHQAYKDEINIQIEKYKNANSNKCSNDVMIKFDHLQPVDTKSFTRNVFDAPFSSVRINIPVDTYFKDWSPSYSSYLDTLTASQNNMILGIYTHTDKEGEAKLIYYDPIVLVSFKAMNNQTANTETMQPYLAYRSAGGDIGSRTAIYDIQRDKLKDPVDFTIRLNDTFKNIKYSHSLFEPEIMEPQPDVFNNTNIPYEYTVKSLNYTGRYIITTKDDTNEFILSNMQEKDKLHNNQECREEILCYGDLIRSFDVVSGSFAYIEYTYNDYKGEFIPLKIKQLMLASRDHPKCCIHRERVFKFFDLFPKPTNKQLTALSIILDLPLKDMDFIEEIKKLTYKIENSYPDIITSTEDINSSQTSGVSEIYNIDEGVSTITTDSPSETSFMEQDVTEETTASLSTTLTSQYISEVSTAESATKFTFMDEDMSEESTYDLPPKTSTENSEQSDFSDKDDRYDYKKNKTRNQSNGSSQKTASSNYVIGGAFIVAGASNFTNYDEPEEVGAENVDDESSWLQFSKISPILTFYSLDDTIRKRMIIVNWHLHRVACLEEVNHIIKKNEMEIDNDEGVYSNEALDKTFIKKNVKKDSQSDVYSMGYTIAPMKEIEIIIEDINDLPGYLQDEVTYYPIRDVLYHMASNLKIIDFIKRDLPQLSEFKITEKSGNHHDDRSFMVGNSPWFSIMNSLHSIEWYKENIWEKRSSNIFSNSGDNRCNLSKFASYIFGRTYFNGNNMGKFTSMINLFDCIISNNDNMKIADICKPNEETEKTLIELDVLPELNIYLDTKIIAPKTILSKKQNIKETLAPVESELFLEPLTDEGLPKSNCDCKVTSKEKRFY